LFKKAFVADRLAPMVTPIYAQAAAGSSIAALPAWMAALGFTFQIYFDFSGYTDMALGIARFFGIKLPPNFNSPLRASSIIDFWLRWHMTLTRFLTAYIYNPLALALTRRRMTRTGEAFTGHNKSVGAFLELLMFPTMLTMLISGIWHGAGYLFILWGLLHGLYLSINHAWRLTGAKLWRDKASYQRFMQPVGFVITFLCVVASMVLFRSTNMTSMSAILRGMAGLHGLKGLSGMAPEVSLSSMLFWIFAAAFIAFLCPDTLQVLGRYEPALGWKPAPSERQAWVTRIAWSPSLAWAVVVSIIATIGILHLGGQSEFLYWQF